MSINLFQEISVLAAAAGETISVNTQPANWCPLDAGIRLILGIFYPQIMSLNRSFFVLRYNILSSLRLSICTYHHLLAKFSMSPVPAKQESQFSMLPSLRFFFSCLMPGTESNRRNDCKKILEFSAFGLALELKES